MSNPRRSRYEDISSETRSDDEDGDDDDDDVEAAEATDGADNEAIIGRRPPDLGYAELRLTKIVQVERREVTTRQQTRKNADSVQIGAGDRRWMDVETVKMSQKKSSFAS